MLTKEQYHKMLEVRKITNYGMMFVRRALERTEWNVENAIKLIETEYSHECPYKLNFKDDATKAK